MRLVFQLALATLLLASPAIADEADWIAERSDGSRLELPRLNGSLPSPKEILGYPLGTRFSRHQEIVGYFRQLAANSERVALWEYGRTYEDRPLVLAAISSAENIERLDELRQRQLKLADPGAVLAADLDTLIEEAPINVWLAYGIHGNESSSSETAMAAAFVLATADGPWADALDDIVILIDPLVNPDGHERYVQSYASTSGRQPDPYSQSAEHQEPWPGGRQNHYLIDLNRDWAWATQRETRSRLREYRRWEPHIYVDFHEMSSQSTYFFPPSAEPIHPVIDSATVGWLEVFGSANAQAFDERGWTYYVGENFDLFYPGYSDSYPSLRGAIGMTYEMAGHGRAGLAVARPDGSLLSLADRIARHLTTTLTTLQTAIANRGPIVQSFVDGRQRSSATSGQTYLWRADQAEAREAADLLARHGLSLDRLSEPRSIEARPLAGGTPSRQTFAAGTYLLPTSQPLGSLARSLMDLSTPMPAGFLAEQRQRLEQNRSTEFFDITTWSVPLAFNLEAYVADGMVKGEHLSESQPVSIHGKGDFGYLVRPQGLASHRFASLLLAQDIQLRLTLSEFDQGNDHFPPGTLFVPANGNSATSAQQLSELAQRAGVEISRTSTALADSGVSLGSNSVVPLRQPRIGLIGGNGVRPTSFGFIWFLLDQELLLPYSRLNLDSLDRVDLAEFDILVMPGGNGYSSRLDSDMSETLDRWISGGGILIAVADAVSWLRDRELTTVEEWAAPQEEMGPNDVSELTPARRTLSTPGAALRTVARVPHPLTVGLEESPAMLFRGRTILLPTGNPQRDLIVAAADNPVAAGFVWPEVEERLQGSLLVGIERRKRGAIVIFSQDPFFRLFWRASATPFLNALLYASSLNEYGQLFD